MPIYPDRRSRFSAAYPWEAASVVSTTRAVRGSAPRDSFRIVTADVPEPDKQEWTQQLDGTWAKKPLETPKQESGTQTPAVAPATAGEAPNALDKASAALAPASSSDM